MEILHVLNKQKINQNIVPKVWRAALYLQHMGSSSLTRDGTQTPCIGNTESQPLEVLPLLWFQASCHYGSDPSEAPE